MADDEGAINKMRPLIATAFLLASAFEASAMTITLNSGAGLSGNAAAQAAFTRAAQSWQSLFSDPILVTLDVDLVNLGVSSVIGQANSVQLEAGYSTIVSAVKADAADEASNGIVAALPTAAQFLADMPVGFSLSGNVFGTKANLKALGFTGLDGQFGVSDGTIRFNSNFAFDYDRSDGISAGTLDFELVAAHEIGHALGFVSAVDQIDQTSSGAISLSILDLFRFSAPPTPGTFTTAHRNLVAGAPAVFSDGTNSFAMSTGVAKGDGRQASHWKDNSITGTYIGVMDPTLGFGEIGQITAADIRAFDLIGYDVINNQAPEPASFALASLGVAGILFYRRKRA